MRAEAAYQVDQYHLRLLRLKGLAVDCPILHRSDRVVDGRGDQLFPHRQGATRLCWPPREWAAAWPGYKRRRVSASR